MTTDSGATSAGGATSGGDTSRTDVAKEQAAGVGQRAASAGSSVAQTASEQAGEVAHEAQRQVRDLAGEARQQVSSQAGQQQQRAAGALRSFGDELRGMADGQGAQGGLAGELATQAAERARAVADWLEQREPTELVDEVRSLARRRPGAFLVGAAIAGVVAGRLTRGVSSAQQGGGSSSGTSPRPVGTSYTGTTGPTRTTGTPAAVHGRDAVGERVPSSGPLATDPQVGTSGGGVMRP